MPKVAAEAPEYIAQRIEPDPESGCWIWTGTIGRGGYGRAQVGGRAGRQRMAHRVVWEVLRGLVPEELDLDHLCRNKCCVNPDHLEPVSHRVNVLRGASPVAQQARMTHCSRGHELSGENVYTPPSRPNQRICHTCRTERHSAPEYRAKQRDAQALRRKRAKAA